MGDREPLSIADFAGDLDSVLRRVRGQGATIPFEFGMVLRFRSAATSVQRTARAELEVGGCPIPKGTRLVGYLWAVNRDQSVFPQPDVFDPEGHRDSPHVAFGYGVHHCLGAALARAELQEALIALSSRIDCPVIEEGASWLPPVGINGPLALPIRFTARGAR